MRRAGSGACPGAVGVEVIDIGTNVLSLIYILSQQVSTDTDSHTTKPGAY